MKLLHVDSSILGQGSVSRQLSRAIVDRIVSDHEGAQISRRDLGDGHVPHLSGAEMAAAKGGEADEATRAAMAVGAEVLAEFLAADVVVIGAPMYNFGIPSTLKAWVDRLAIAGQTFRYTEQGAVGLAGGKRVIVASARGGHYAPGTPLAAIDFEEPYLRAVFGFFGITEIEIIRAEGVAIGPDQRQAALSESLAEVSRLAA